MQSLQSLEEFKSFYLLKNKAEYIFKKHKKTE